MNITKTLIAASAIALLGTGAAFAQEATSDAWMQTSSAKSRADVRAEVVTARQAGLTQAWTEGYIEPAAASTVQRADVRQQTLQAIRSGEINAINAEVAGVAPATAALLRNAG